MFIDFEYKSVSALASFSQHALASLLWLASASQPALAS